MSDSIITVMPALALAFAVAWSGARVLAALRVRAALDHPNERSLHDTPTPRTGGLGIIAGIVCGHLWLLGTGDVPGRDGLVMAGAAVLIMGVSLVDDLRGLPVLIRMVAHALAAAALLAAGFSVSELHLPGVAWSPPQAVAAAFTLLLIVWMINLYNFMDGMDGLAGGMGAIGFMTLGVLAARSGDGVFAASCVVIAAACCGFLLVNFPPARIFMGDAGSSVLGFLAAALSLEAQRRGLFPLWLSMLVFSPFIVDATVTLLRRALNGERVWQAHSSHFYQRLVHLGWGHRRTTLWEYLLMLGCAATAIAVHSHSATVQAIALTAWAMAYTVLMAFVTFLERRGTP